MCHAALSSRKIAKLFALVDDLGVDDFFFGFFAAVTVGRRSVC
jgi:hypothetical protein